MFEAHFGLRENPFSTSHDPRFVYPSSEHLEAVAHFRYGMQNREAFVLVTGEVGTGKTTAVRDLISRLPQQAHVALLQNTALSRRELLEEVCHRFGVAWDPDLSKPGVIERLERTLGERVDRGETCLLVIDEAQNLSTDLLEEIRLLSNLEWGGGHLLHICLAGQPELEDRLATPEMRQLRQRISVKYHLKPLDVVQTERYVHHRLLVAGGDAPRILPADACAALHAITHGIPREINIVAAQALLNAYVDGSAVVRPEHVRQVVEEFGFQSVLAKPKAAQTAQVVPIAPGAAPAPDTSRVSESTAPPTASPLLEPQPLAPVSARPAVAPSPRPEPPPVPRAPAVAPQPAQRVAASAAAAATAATALATPPEPIAPASPAKRSEPRGARPARSIGNWRDRLPTPLAFARGRPAPAAEPAVQAGAAASSSPARPTTPAQAEPAASEPLFWRLLDSVGAMALLLAILAAVIFGSGLAGNLWRSISSAGNRAEVSNKPRTSVSAAPSTSSPTPSAPAPAPSAAPAQVPITGPHYGLQVGSFRTQRRAQTTLAALEGQSGLRGSVEPFATADGPWFRVVLGAFATPAEATATGNQLSARGAIPADRVVVHVSGRSSSAGAGSPR